MQALLGMGSTSLAGGSEGNCCNTFISAAALQKKIKNINNTQWPRRRQIHLLQLIVECIWEYLLAGDWFEGGGRGIQVAIQLATNMWSDVPNPNSMGIRRSNWTSRLQPWGAVCMLSIFTWCKKTFPRVLVHIETLQTYLVWGLNPRPSLYVLMIWSLIHQVAIHKSTKFNMYPSP